MLPNLFTIGPFALHTYGLMLVLGFLAGVKIAEHRAQKTDIKPAFIWDLFMVVVLSAIVGARGFYVALNYDEFRGNPLSIISPFQPDGTLGIGGLVFIGGLILAVIAAVVYIRYRHYSFLTVLDVCIPGAAVGLAIGRLGCFFAGCCYGLPTDLPWGVTFPHACPAGAYQGSIGGIPLHPSQIYMSLGDGLVALLVFLLERFKKFQGHTLLVFIMLYAVDRSLVDLVRWYPESERHSGLTHNQIILSVAFVASVVTYAVLAARAKKTGIKS